MFHLHYFQVPISTVPRNPDKADILIADSFPRKLCMPPIIAGYSTHWIKVEVSKWSNNCYQCCFSSYEATVVNVKTLVEGQWAEVKSNEYHKVGEQVQRTERRGTYGWGETSHTVLLSAAVTAEFMGVASHSQYLKGHTWHSLSNFPTLPDSESEMSADSIALERAWFWRMFGSAFESKSPIYQLCHLSVPIYKLG